MDIHIRHRNVEHSSLLEDHIRHRLLRSLGRLGHHVRRVVVRLFDVNGTRGGRDKRCRVVIDLNNGQQVFLDERRHCFYDAVNRTTQRAKSEVSASLDRWRTRRSRRRVG